MKRSPIKHSLNALSDWRKRGQAKARAEQREQRVKINPMSKKRKAANVERAKVPMKDYCEVQRAFKCHDVSDFPRTARHCLGSLTKHEVKTRARGGSITDPANIRTVCAWHNSWLSQSPEGLKWGHANGFLLHAHDEDLEGGEEADA